MLAACQDSSERMPVKEQDTLYWRGDNGFYCQRIWKAHMTLGPVLGYGNAFLNSSSQEAETGRCLQELETSMNITSININDYIFVWPQSAI